MTADALHDSWVFKDKNYSIQEKKDLSLKFNKRWHALDAAIKGFIVVLLIYSWLGFSWWIAILVFDYMVIRWIWFDACWNWFNKLSFWYRGSVAKSDSIKISDKLFFLLKFGLLITSLTGTIILIN
jgi:hypothetical protein